MVVTAADLPPPAYAAALASVDGLGPRRLRRLLAATPPPRAAWASVLGGHPDDVSGGWRAAAQEIDVAALWSAHRERGIGVAVLGDPGFPSVLADDPEAPAVLYFRGDPKVIERFPRVALLGTRRPTRYGLGLAAQLGAELSAVGVSVLSGLDPGIDGAAHEGSCAGWAAGRPDSAPPVGVVAGGLDHPSPGGSATLFERVAGCGVVFSESPIGAPEAAWRSRPRHRVLATLADVVVVIECHHSGGALHTVRAAARRGVSVGAVPGSVRSPASAGTNDLLADGCFVVRDVTDALVALGLARAGNEPVRAPARRAPRR